MKVVVTPIFSTDLAEPPTDWPGLTVRPTFYRGKLRANAFTVKSYTEGGELLCTALIQASGKDGSLHLLDVSAPVTAEIDKPAEKPDKR